MGMTGELLKADLIKDEGIRYTVYDDATGKRIVPGYSVIGHPTIGVGRCMDLNGLSGIEIDYLLSNDIDSTIDYCNSYFWFKKLSETRQLAMANMMFQLGPQKFSGFQKFISCMSIEDWKGAHDAGLDSVWAKQQTPDRATRLMTTILYDVVPK